MSNLREIQLCELEMLKAAKDICEKHNLTYYLSCGTLLGAIRHNGFIPWDDDIDIEMPVEDYQKFLQIARNELPAHFFLQTYKSDPGYNELWAKIRANGTTSMPVSSKNLHIHWGLCIDIFPLVGNRNPNGENTLQSKILTLCHSLLSKDYILATNCEDISHNKKLKMIYALPRSCRIFLCSLLSRYVFMATKHAEYYSMVADRLYYKLSKDLYEGKCTHAFEGSNYSIPSEYDALLTTLYGDYMTPPPIEDRNGHIGELGEIIFDCHKNYTEYQD